MARTAAGRGRSREKATETPVESPPEPASAGTPAGNPPDEAVTQPEAAPEPARSDTAEAPPPEPEPILPEITAEGADSPTEPLRRGIPQADAPVPSPTAGRGGGLAGFILGGVVAAALGAGAALWLMPQGWRGIDTALFEQRLTALEGRQTSPALTPEAMDSALAPIAERLAAVEAALPGLAPLAALDTARPDLAPLEARLATLEAVAPAVSEETTALLERLEDELSARIEARIEAALAAGMAVQQARAEAIESAREAVAEAQGRIAARAALADLSVAAQTGAPAGTALQTLAAETDLPPALEAFRTGLRTQAGLQRDFPAAARAALAAAPVDEGDSLGDRLLTLLRAQTGARSLAPREGDDPDAILSRAEALLRSGDLSGALTELDTLPAAAAAAMADWRDRAETRLAALAALGDLAARFGVQ